jgi:hypothetical protein
MTKIIKISKEKYNYLKQNKNDIQQIIKSIDKRQKMNLPVRIQNSSELSEEDLVSVDVSGQKQTVGEGFIAVRDMPIRRRAFRRQVGPAPAIEVAAEQEQEEEQEDEHLNNNLIEIEIPAPAIEAAVVAEEHLNDNEEELELDDQQLEVEDLQENQVELLGLLYPNLLLHSNLIENPTIDNTAHESTYNLSQISNQTPTSFNQSQQSDEHYFNVNIQNDINYELHNSFLPKHLSDIVNNLYSCLIDNNFDNELVQTPLLELSEFKMHTLSINENDYQHIQAIKNQFKLAEITRISLDRTYALRCFNTFLVKRVYIQKLMVNDSMMTDSEAISILKEKLTEAEPEIVWITFINCCSRGKKLFEFMHDLELGNNCKFLFIF